MTTQEAYRAGFLLKCASLGLPAETAQTLLDRPETVKQGFTGQVLGGGYNAIRGVAKGTGNLVGAAQQAGMQAGTGKPSVGSPSAKGLSEDTLQNLLLAAHYDRARKALLTPR